MKKPLKPNLKSLLWLSAVSFVFTSCTIEQHYDFKKDFSGSYYTRVDVSSMAEFGADDATMDSVMSDESLSEMSDQYSKIPGISNSISKYEDHVITSGFDFASVNSLNAAFKAAAEETDTKNTDGGLFIFEVKKKQMAITLNNKGMEALTGPDANGAEEYITIEATMHFERKIKKVSGGMATLNAENNTVQFKFTPKELSDPSTRLNTVIKFK